MVLFEDHAPALASAVIILCFFGYLTFGLRAYTRLVWTSWGLEDWIMACAIPPFTVLSIACIAAAFTGVGATNATLSLPGNEGYQEKGLFWFFLFEVFYCITIIPIKLSIGFMLVRIASGRPVYVWIQYVIMGMFTTMNLTAGLYIIFHCNPVAAAWDYSLLETGGKCNDAVILADIYYATTAVNILTDWITAFMPIPLLWNVQMNRNAKISVATVLGLGFIAFLSACVRLKYTVNLTAAENYLFAICDITIWGYAENAMGLTVGCVATLRPMFQRVLNLGSTSGGNTKTTAPSRTAASSNMPSASRWAYTECEENGGGSIEMKKPRSVPIVIGVDKDAP